MAVPVHMILKILAKLPFRSVVRFRCLSKFYASLGENPFLVRAHAIHFPIRPIGLLVTCPAPLQSAQMFFSVDNIGGRVNSLLRVPDKFSRYSTHSVKGLVCMDFGILAKVCNPSTRQVTTLPFVCEPQDPKASSTFYCVNTFGFDPVNMKFKVLNSWAIPGKPTEYRVFTLGDDKKWRPLNGPPLFPQRESLCIDGVVYFRSWNAQSTSRGAVLVAFDVGNEQFSVIKFPNLTEASLTQVPSEASNTDLIQYKGGPVIVDYQYADDNFVCFWELIGTKWKMYSKFCSFISKKGPEGNQWYFAAGSSPTGELLMVPRSRRFLSSLWVTYWHPETKGRTDYQVEGLPQCQRDDFSSDAIRFTDYEESILSV